MSIWRQPIRAISIDLDDTLWPVRPTLEYAEARLQHWLSSHAPDALDFYRRPDWMHETRVALLQQHPDLAYDMIWLRREIIRQALMQAGAPEALARPAFDVFYAARQRVRFFDDALPALDWLRQRYLLVALSNGNASVHQIGIDHYFTAAINARQVGAAKPDVRIFQAAAQAAGVPREWMLHVGDDAQLDGLGALNAGMQFAWVNRDGAPWPGDKLHPLAEVTDLQQLCKLLHDNAPGPFSGAMPLDAAVK